MFAARPICLAFAIQRMSADKSAKWNLLELDEVSRSKLIELNQDTLFDMSSPIRVFLTYNGNLMLTPVNSPSWSLPV